MARVAGCRCEPNGLHAPEVALDVDGLRGPRWCGARVLAAAAHRAGSTAPRWNGRDSRGSEMLRRSGARLAAAAHRQGAKGSEVALGAKGLHAPEDGSARAGPAPTFRNRVRSVGCSNGASPPGWAPYHRRHARRGAPSGGSRRRAPADLREALIGPFQRVQVGGVVKIERRVREPHDPSARCRAPRP